MAREELRRLQAALDRMPARCREAVVLKKIEGLSMREIATRMGISFKTVDRHLSDGAQYLADFIYGHADESRKKP
jgi:RNA polymerase sigma-70 factor (ECF subfamily)